VNAPGVKKPEKFPNESIAKSTTLAGVKKDIAKTAEKTAKLEEEASAARRVAKDWLEEQGISKTGKEIDKTLREMVERGNEKAGPFLRTIEDLESSVPQATRREIQALERKLEGLKRVLERLQMPDRRGGWFWE
jgi:hypothetical protein